MTTFHTWSANGRTICSECAVEQAPDRTFPCRGPRSCTWWPAGQAQEATIMQWRLMRGQFYHYDEFGNPRYMDRYSTPKAQIPRVEVKDDYWQMRKQVLATEHEEGVDPQLMARMIACVTPAVPDMDRVAAEPWPAHQHTAACRGRCPTFTEPTVVTGTRIRIWHSLAFIAAIYGIAALLVLIFG